jgi:hypothetical protein
MKNIFILHARDIYSNHTFIELFTTENNLKKFLQNNPQIEQKQTTLHEINPK